MKTTIIVLTALLLVSGLVVHTSTPALIVTLNGEVFRPDSDVIVSGQSEPNARIRIVMSYLGLAFWTGEARADGDGHWKTNMLHESLQSSLTPGAYQVEVSDGKRSARGNFTVKLNDSDIYRELSDLVAKTRADALKVYSYLDPETGLAAEMRTHLDEGEAHYLKALSLAAENRMEESMDELRGALRGFGDALCFDAMLSSVAPLSANAQKIWEIYESIRRLNDTHTEFINTTSNQPSGPAWNPLEDSEKLIVEANAQVDKGRVDDAYSTLKKLDTALEKARGEAMSISSSTTLSRLGGIFKEVQKMVESLEEKTLTRLKEEQVDAGRFEAVFASIVAKFDLIQWIDSVAGNSGSGHPAASEDASPAIIDANPLIGGGYTNSNRDEDCPRFSLHAWFGRNAQK
jgi:hypothetical protein